VDRMDSSTQASQGKAWACKVNEMRRSRWKGGKRERWKQVAWPRSHGAFEAVHSSSPPEQETICGKGRMPMTLRTSCSCTTSGHVLVWGGLLDGPPRCELEQTFTDFGAASAFNHG